MNQPSWVYRSSAAGTAILGVAVALVIGPCFAAAPQLGRPRTIELPGRWSDWKEQEHWVWKQICNGRQANLQEYSRTKHRGGDHNDASERELTQPFLETILLHEPYLSAIPRLGVKIKGARFATAINLANAELTHQLAITNSRFEGDLSLQGLSTEGELSIGCNVIDGSLDISELHAKSLVLRGVTANKVVLRGANVSRQLIMIGATIMDTLDMDGLQVGQHLILRTLSWPT